MAIIVCVTFCCLVEQLKVDTSVVCASICSVNNRFWGRSHSGESFRKKKNKRIGLLVPLVAEGGVNMCGAWGHEVLGWNRVEQLHFLSHNDVHYLSHGTDISLLRANTF